MQNLTKRGAFEGVIAIVGAVDASTGVHLVIVTSDRHTRIIEAEAFEVFVFPARSATDDSDHRVTAVPAFQQAGEQVARLMLIGASACGPLA